MSQILFKNSGENIWTGPISFTLPESCNSTANWGPLFKDKLYDKNWVINSKEPFKGPEPVLEYLGRYTHKITISNYQILNKEKKEVIFSYIDKTVQYINTCNTYS